MAKRNIVTALTGLTGVLIVLGILIALNAVLGAVRIRADMTEDNIYTLSAGTKQMLAALDRTVTLKFYFSRSAEGVPIPVKNYAQRVLALLREYQAQGGGRIVLETYDPRPDSDEEEWAQRYGLTAESLGMIGMGPQFYLGLVAGAGVKEAALPFLTPSSEPQLEYFVTRLIYEVTQAHRPKIAIMSSLPVMGRAASPFAPGQRSRGWAIASELARQYDVVPAGTEAEEIPDDAETLVLIHPKRLSDRTLYAIDQFVLRGGRLLAFVDPFCAAERESQEGMPPGMMGPAASEINKLTKAWGYEMAPTDVVADLKAASPVSLGDGTAERLPTWLSLRGECIDRGDIATSPLEFLMMPFAGAFKGEPAEGLAATALVQSYDETTVVNASQATEPGVEKMRNARPEGRAVLALRLQGKFKSAFPAGPPPVAESMEGENAAEAGERPHIAEGEKESVVVLVSDVDMIYDRFCLRALNLFGQAFYEPINDNLSFALNMIEQIAGNEALIGLRSRGVFDRPFDRVIELERRAQQRWQEEELKLTSRLEEAQARLNELQQTKKEDQQFILSPEQKVEIENFRKERFETQRQLKQVRKNLRGEIERLGLALKVINMAAMPALVAACGLFHGWRRRRRSAA